MEPPTVGQVVLIPFPYSDLSQSKLRPALVIASPGRGDFILCQITSNPYADTWAVELTDEDFQTGSLERTSYARPGKLFTGNVALFHGSAGTLKPASLLRVVDPLMGLIRAEPQE